MALSCSALVHLPLVSTPQLRASTEWGCSSQQAPSCRVASANYPVRTDCRMLREAAVHKYATTSVLMPSRHLHNCQERPVLSQFRRRGVGRQVVAEQRLDGDVSLVQKEISQGERDVMLQDASSFSSSLFTAFFGLAIGCSLVAASLFTESAIAAPLDHQHIPLDKDSMQALAFNFDPLYDEFWDNTRRWILYFFSVTSGGLYMLVKPVGDLLKKPVTAALTVVILGGSFYLVFTVLQLMLGITEA